MYNKVVLIGRLTAQPEITQTPSGKVLTRVTLAVNRRFKSETGERTADFISVIFWGKLAETLVSYGSKGSLLSVDGEMRTRRYEKDGHSRQVIEVLGQSFQLLESRAQRAFRENNGSADLADLVLDAEPLPF